MTTKATTEERAAGAGYEELFVPALFGAWTHHVLKAADVRAGDELLDVACGTGILARDALQIVGPSGRVVGLDPGPGMIATAKAKSRAIEWIVAAAEDMPFPDDSFDVLVSQFGIMFFSDRPKAVREMMRVLRPGGRLAVAAWHGIEHNPAYQDVVALLNKEVGADAAHATEVPFSLGDPDEGVISLKEAGFTDVSYESHAERARFPSTRTMVEVELRGWLPLFDIRLAEDKITTVLTASDAVLAKYRTDSGTAEFDTKAFVVSARKP